MSSLGDSDRKETHYQEWVKQVGTTELKGEAERLRRQRLKVFERRPDLEAREHDVTLQYGTPTEKSLARIAIGWRW